MYPTTRAVKWEPRAREILAHRAFPGKRETYGENGGKPVSSFRGGIVVLLVLCLAGCSAKKGEEEKSSTEQQKTLAEGLKYGSPGGTLAVMQTRVLATIRDDEKPVSATTFTGHNAAPAANSQATTFEIVFNEQGHGVAYKGGKGGKVAAVFNGKAGPLYKDIGAMAISPDGRRFVYTALDDKNIWHLVTDGKEDLEFHHLGTPVFSPDSRHVAVQASANEDWYIVLDDKQSKGGKYSFDQPVFSADSAKIAYVENLDNDLKKLYIADLQLKSRRIVDSVVSPVVTSPDRTQVAVVITRQGKERLVRISFDQPDVVKEEGAYDSISNIQIGQDGKSVAYIAMKGNVHYQVLNNREEKLENTPLKPSVLNPAGSAVAVILASPEGMRVRTAFSSGGEKGKSYDDIEGTTFSKDGSQLAYVATKGKSCFVVSNGSEGPPFDKVVKPIFTPDGKRLVYRARKDGKRFVVVANTDGTTLRQHPAYEQVFQPVISPDGKSVAYGVQDGRKLVWVVEKL
jgi:WD40 repeat protein